MKRKDVAALLVLCSVIASICARPVEFTEDTFEEFISEDDAWLILLYVCRGQIFNDLRTKMFF